MILSRRKISFIQLLRIDEGHLGQCHPVYSVALGATTKVSPEGSYLLQSCLYQQTFGVTSAEIRCHRNPGQTSRFKNNGGSTSIRENTLLKLLQAFQGTVETEAVARPGLLIQTTNLMATSAAEVDTNTPDQCRLL
jgi:hypothetical protein